MTITEAKIKINKILDDVNCSKAEFDNEVSPIIDALNTKSELEKKLEEEHPVGFCKVPENIEELPMLSIGTGGFLAPKFVNNMGSASRTDNQGQKPWCAAYSCANWAEFIKWKLEGYPKNIDPSWIYKYAKTIDGDPDGEGTTLPAVLQALLDHDIFDKKKCKIKNIWNRGNPREMVKYAVFKFGAILGAFNITTEWYKVNKNKTSVVAKEPHQYCGGHAVIIIGYNDDGVFIQNSWGTEYGDEGFLLLTWKAFDEQFLYASVLSNVLDGLTINT